MVPLEPTNQQFAKLNMAIPPPFADHAALHPLPTDPYGKTSLQSQLNVHAENPVSSSPVACNLAGFRKRGTECCSVPLGGRKSLFSNSDEGQGSLACCSPWGHKN